MCPFWLAIEPQSFKICKVPGSVRNFRTCQIDVQHEKRGHSEAFIVIRERMYVLLGCVKVDAEEGTCAEDNIP